MIVILDVIKTLLLLLVIFIILEENKGDRNIKIMSTPGLGFFVWLLACLVGFLSEYLTSNFKRN